MSARPTPPPFRPHELATGDHAKEGHLSELRDLKQRHAAELAQWCDGEGVGATAAALLALLAALPRSARRPLSCGLQAPRRALAEALGASPRMVVYATRRLEELGYARQHQATRQVAHLTRHRPPSERRDSFEAPNGHTYSKASIVPTLYPTPAGLAWLASARGSGTRRYVPGRGRQRLAEGLWTEVLRTIGRSSAALGRSAPAPVGHCTPYEAKPHERDCGRAPRPVGSGAGPPDSPARSPEPDARWRAALMAEGWPSAAAELAAECWSRNAMTAASAWPKAWRWASDAEREVLTSRFAPIRTLLGRRLASGPA